MNYFRFLKYAGSIALFFILLMFCMPLVKAQQNGETIPQSERPDTIEIASEPNYPPYCIVDENGKADGFSVELFKAAAKEVNLVPTIKTGVWDQIKQDLANGEIDALPLVGRTPERENIFDFTMPYLSLHGAVFVRKGTSGIQSLEDLEGKEIGVMEGDNAEEFVRRENVSDKIFTTNTYDEAFLKLASGQYDAVITQRITGLMLLENMKIESIEPLDFQLPQFRQDFCFAVQEGNEQLLQRLNEGLSIVIANGTFDEIHSKWFGPRETETLSTFEILKITAKIIIPLAIIMVIIWIVFLRKEVKRHTRNLNQEIQQHKKTMETLNSQQTLLKNSEEQIRLLLNSTAEGIYGIDTNGNCTFINQSALQILGFPDKRQLIGKNMHNLIHHTRPDGSECKIEDCEIYKAFRAGIETHSDDDILWRADRTSFPAEYFSHPIIQNGKITGSVVTFWDISERKKAENELIQLKNDLKRQVDQRTAELQEKVQKLDKSQKAMLYMVEDLNNITTELKEERRKLKSANDEMEAFTYSVSHDLRAPLRAINGFSKFLVEDYADQLDDEGKRFIDTIRENASKMDTLISDLLNLSRVSRSGLTLSKVDMQAIAASMFREMADEEEQKTFDVNIRAMPAVTCDSNLIKQVWQNLIGNALKYSSKSTTKKIEIGALENKNETTFYIKDSGAGFNQKYKNKLFGVFQRLHHDHEFKGTGVGLAIVQRIVLRHGGKVWATGEIDNGATFYFSLPRQ